MYSAVHAKCQFNYKIYNLSLLTYCLQYCSCCASNRSTVTGKINESIEMFTCRDSLLAPLKPVTHFGADDADETADSDSTKSLITALPSAPESADKSAGSAVKKNNVSSAASQANHNQRLITFDSTDPEFDEYSDPHADLDL